MTSLENKSRAQSHSVCLVTRPSARGSSAQGTQGVLWAQSPSPELHGLGQVPFFCLPQFLPLKKPRSRCSVSDYPAGAAPAEPIVPAVLFHLLQSSFPLPLWSPRRWGGSGGTAGHSWLCFPWEMLTWQLSFGNNPAHSLSACLFWLPLVAVGDAGSNKQLCLHFGVTSAPAGALCHVPAPVRTCCAHRGIQQRGAGLVGCWLLNLQHRAVPNPDGFSQPVVWSSPCLAPTAPEPRQRHQHKQVWAALGQHHPLGSGSLQARAVGRREIWGFPWSSLSPV